MISKDREIKFLEESVRRAEIELREVKTQLQDRDTKLTRFNHDREQEQAVLDEMLKSAQEQIDIIETLEQQNSDLSERLRLAERDLDDHRRERNDKASRHSLNVELGIQAATARADADSSSTISPTTPKTHCAAVVPTFEVGTNTEADRGLSLGEELARAFGNGEIPVLDEESASHDTPPERTVNHPLIPEIRLRAATGAPSYNGSAGAPVFISVGVQTMEDSKSQECVSVIKNKKESLCQCEAARLLAVALQQVSTIKKIITNDSWSLGQRMRELEALYPDARESTAETVDEIDQNRESRMFQLQGYSGMSDAKFERVPGSPGTLALDGPARENFESRTNSKLLSVISLSKEVVRRDSPILGHSNDELCEESTLNGHRQIPRISTNSTITVPPRRDSLWPLSPSGSFVTEASSTRQFSRISSKSSKSRIRSLNNGTESRNGVTDKAHSSMTPRQAKSFAASLQEHDQNKLDLHHGSGSVKPIVIKQNQVASRSVASSSSTFSSFSQSTFSPHMRSPKTPRPDPMIGKMTQCVIGTDMYKYVRTQKRSIFGSRKHYEDGNYRHKRFVTLKPHDGTICWSSSRQAGLVLGQKRYYIEEIFDVEDSTPISPNQSLHNRSLLIVSEGRSLKFTAQDEKTHSLWHEVITYLLHQRKSALQAPPIASLHPPLSIDHHHSSSSQNLSGSSRRRSASFTSRRLMTARPAPIPRHRPSMPDLSRSLRPHHHAPPPLPISELEKKKETEKSGGVSSSSSTTTTTLNKAGVKFREQQMTLRAGMASPSSTRSAIVSAVPRLPNVHSSRRPSSLNGAGAAAGGGSERTLSAFMG